MRISGARQVDRSSQASGFPVMFLCLRKMELMWGDPESVCLRAPVRKRNSSQAFQASLLSLAPYINVKQWLQNTGMGQNLQGSLKQIAEPP